MTNQQSQTVLLKVDPLSTIRNNKFFTEGEKLETVVAVRVFVSNLIYRRRLESGDIKDMGFRIFLVMHVSGLRVFKKNLKVYI